MENTNIIDIVDNVINILKDERVVSANVKVGYGFKECLYNKIGKDNIIDIHCSMVEPSDIPELEVLFLNNPNKIIILDEFSRTIPVAKDLLLKSTNNNKVIINN